MIPLFGSFEEMLASRPSFVITGPSFMIPKFRFAIRYCTLAEEIEGNGKEGSRGKITCNEHNLASTCSNAMWVNAVTPIV